MAVQYLAKSGKLIEFGFDKEVDRTQIFIPELIEDHGLDESEFEDIKNALKDAFKVRSEPFRALLLLLAVAVASTCTCLLTPQAFDF